MHDEIYLDKVRNDFLHIKDLAKNNNTWILTYRT